MKYTLLLTLLLSLSIPTLAEYVPFVVEGKTWEMKLIYSWPTNGMERIQKCELKGDTTINEKIYKKYFEDGEYRGAFREEAKRVYYCIVNQEMLYYDFNLKENDVFSYDYIVVQEDFIVSYGQKLKRLGLHGESDSPDMISYWIEGVGGLEGPKYPFYVNRDGGVNVTLLSCHVGDQYLYHSTEVKVESPTPPLDSSRERGAIYDLSGRKTPLPRNGEGLPKGIYIRNSKKMLIK